MMGRIIGFFKTPAGAAILFVVGTFIFFYFVREYQERSAEEKAAAEAGKVNLERLGQMAPEEVPKKTTDPIASEWVEDNKFDKFAPKRPAENPPPIPVADPKRPAPKELPKLVHFFDGNRPQQKRTRRKTFPPKHYAPPGTLIPCQLIITVDSSSLDTPVVGFVTEDVWHNQNLIIPAGTEVHSFAKQGRVRDRIEVKGDWRFVWHDGRQVNVRGIALDREHDQDKDEYGITDGSAGIRGRIAKTDELLEFKMFASTAISGIARSSKETSESIFGNLPRNSIGNSALEGASAVADRYAKLLLDQIEGDGLYVRVPAGTEFYVYTQQVFEPKLASVAGFKQGESSRNSWEPAQEPSTRDTELTAPTPLTTDAVLRHRGQLLRSVESRLRYQEHDERSPRL